MADYRKVIIVLIITVLFAVFVFSLNAAMNESPKYEKFCKNQMYTAPMAKPAPPGGQLPNCTSVQASKDEFNACADRGDYIEYQYDSQGCSTEFSCNTCQHEFNLAQEKFQWWMFIISAIFGLIAIIVGLFIPVKQDSVGEAVSTGFLLGGLVTLFIGTALSFPTLYKWLRPVIIFVELMIVIFIAYRKLRKK